MQSKSLNFSLMLIIMIASTFTLASAARAALEIVEDAFEVTPGQIEWPTYDEGRLVVHPCPGCEAVALTVNHQTGYYLGFTNPGLSRQELIRKATSSGNSENILVYLFYRPENRQVTRVVLDMGPK
jgi:uncharacterized protein YaiE (UPF0345 family)